MIYKPTKNASEDIALAGYSYVLNMLKNRIDDIKSSDAILISVKVMNLLLKEVKELNKPKEK